MSGRRHPSDDGRAASAAIWDAPVRLFHWTLAALVAIAAATGFLAPDVWLGAHVWAGYGVAGLLVFRAVWGVHGSEYSRFDSFPLDPRGAVSYLRGLANGRPAHGLGHNPLGAAMIVLLGAALLGVVLSGAIALGGEEKQGPLAGVTTYAVGRAARTVHETLSYILLGLVGAHILGVAAHGVIARENLVWPMVTGRKTLALGAPAPRLRPARPAKAAAALALAATGGAIAVYALARLPPLGVRALADNPAYRKECGSCHAVLHPSLLPASSWRALMDSLGDHFGEDASLDPGTAEGVSAWLAANAAETWDTEASHRLRAEAAADPRRVTATPYWRRKHAGLDAALFESRAIGGKTNCSACHRDAASGRFDDQAIAIPKEISR